MLIPPVCVILAGGQGTRLNALAWNRAKPAVPFGGNFRLIDFTLSNSVNSGIQRIGVLTQYLPLSLMDHIGDGTSWDMQGRAREMKILPPQEGASAKDWYMGTAHAIYKNFDFINHGPEKEVLVLSGDHIYHLDYRKMVDFHRRNKAHLTIATMPVSRADASRFGIAVVDANNQIIEFQEKPENPRSLLGSMGIYIMDRDVLNKEFDRIIGEGKTDIGGDLIPELIHSSRVFAFPFEGYWRDVGTLESYWQCSMDIIDPAVSGLNMSKWNMRTNLVSSELLQREPSKFQNGSKVIDSYISTGCKIRGRVIRSILSPGVEVSEGAIVEDSILFHNVKVGRNAKLDKTIADKNVVIGDQTVIGIPAGTSQNEQFPDHLNSRITLIGKNSQIPNIAKIGSNCLVYPETGLDAWDSIELNHGSTVRGSGI